MKMATKKIAALVMAGVMGGSVLTACGNITGQAGGSGGSKSPETAANSQTGSSGVSVGQANDSADPQEETLQLTLMSTDATSDNFDEWLAKVEEICNLEITVVDCPTDGGDRQAKISTILSSGDPSVDIFTVDDEMYSAFRNTGWLEPLQDTVMTPDVVKDYSETYMKDMVITEDGGIYSVPSAFNVIGFYVNHQILNEVGIEALNTYDDFVEFVTKATSGDRYGYGGSWEVACAYNEIGSFVNLFGGDYFDWTNPNTQKAIQLLYDMCHDMGATSMSQLNNQFLPTRERLIDGEIGCAFLPSGNIGAINAAGMYGEDAIQLVIPPTFETCSAYCSSWHFVMNSASEHKEAALRYLRYATSKEGYLNYCDAFKGFPARMDILFDENVKTTGIDDLRAYVEKVSLRGRPMVPECAEFIRGIGSLFQQLVTDEIDMDTFFAMAQEETEKYK